MHTVLSLEYIREHLRNVIRDYCEYSGLSYEEVVKLVERGSDLAKNEWYMYVKSGTDEEIYEFYTQSKYYIYETLQPYLEPEKYKKDVNYLKILTIANKIIKRKGRCRVLDFGAGVGELCLLLAKIGCEVTYCDLPGEISRFALWRFKKYNASINVIWSRINGVDLPSEFYDLIVSDAVLEHLKREYVSNFIQAFSKALVDNGYLYLLWDPTYTEEYPYHILGLREIDEILRSYSLLRISENLYVKSVDFQTMLKHYIWRCRRMCFRVCHFAKRAIRKFVTTIATQK